MFQAIHLCHRKGHRLSAYIVINMLGFNDLMHAASPQIALVLLSGRPVVDSSLPLEAKFNIYKQQGEQGSLFNNLSNLRRKKQERLRTSAGTFARPRSSVAANGPHICKVRNCRISSTKRSVQSRFLLLCAAQEGAMSAQKS